MKREDFEQQELEELEKKLMQLPKIEDKRSKVEIYNQIKKQLNEEQPKKNKQPWLLPTIASVAALVLIVVIAPTLFNKESDMAIPTEERAGLLPEEEMMAPEAGIFMADEITEDNNAVNYISALRSGELSDEQRVVTIPYVDSNAMFIVPVSFMTRSDEPVLSQVERMIEHYDHTLFGLGMSPLRGITLAEQGDNIIVDIPSERLQTGTAELEMLRQSLELVVSSLGYNNVVLSTGGSTSVEFGNYGELSELQVNDRSYGYFFYDTYNNQRLLVPASSIYYPFVDSVPEQLTFEEVMLNMQHTDIGIGYQAAIPQEVSFTLSEDEKGIMIVTFSETVNAISEFILLSMIEAILLTAKDFQYDFIELRGIDLSRMGPYDLLNPISTNIAPNGGGF